MEHSESLVEIRNPSAWVMQQESMESCCYPGRQRAGNSHWQNLEMACHLGYRNLWVVNVRKNSLNILMLKMPRTLLYSCFEFARPFQVSLQYQGESSVVF